MEVASRWQARDSLLAGSGAGGPSAEAHSSWLHRGIAEAVPRRLRKRSREDPC